MPVRKSGDIGASHGDSSPVTVLVADDHASFRDALRDLVAASEGFSLVGEVSSGEDAIDAVSELAPRMVIMDKRMSGIGGIEASRAIAARHPHVVVLLISVEESPDPEVLRSCGAAAFVTKRELSPTVLRNLWQTHGAPNATGDAPDLEASR